MITIVPKLRSVVDHDGAVILDISGNAVTTLNPTGGYIWQRLDRGMSVDEISSELAFDTGSSQATVARDVTTFIEELKSKHLVAVS
jgi:hypothetical protein